MRAGSARIPGRFGGPMHQKARTLGARRLIQRYAECVPTGFGSRCSAGGRRSGTVGAVADTFANKSGQQHQICWTTSPGWPDEK